MVFERLAAPAFAGTVALAFLASLTLPVTEAAAQEADGLAPVREGRDSPFAGLSADQVVRELADREEIRELVATYAHRAALGINLADLFTDDGGFIIRIPGREPMESFGREALDATYREVAARPGRQLPMLHNLVLAIDGDTANGLASIELRGDTAGRNIIASGYYRDTLRRVDGRWRFVTRDVTFFHYTTLEQGWAQPEGSGE